MQELGSFLSIKQSVLSEVAALRDTDAITFLSSAFSVPRLVTVDSLFF